ncbi:lysosomal acid glucosylceramidase-like [Danaus plexippus]|uniref:lysosomal acid glucosylceramidase-like n=1 Tax=Danaus plexippus TaxID=13037 RepID=UPI002AB1F882|nr:lysosomal acid glucosylceramidase-like [Danaus plexippus]
MRTLILLGGLLTVGVYADVPCAPRFLNNSVVCVCNATYCDTVTRRVPEAGTYIAYTSSKSGLRFSITQGDIEDADTSYSSADYGKVFDLQPSKVYQAIEGFGGAATDAAGINWKKMKPAIQDTLVKSYFSEDGLEYNVIRLPIGSTDFSTRFYAYNQYPKDDTALSNFTFAPEDIKYKVPFVKSCLSAANNEVKIVSATWSPPKWMKVKEPQSGISFIKEEFYQVYSDYHCKFAELFEEEGIHIWGISTGNEPLVNMFAGVRKDETAWNAPSFAKFIREYFGPTIKNCSVKDMKILAIEDQRYALPLFFTKLQSDTEAMSYVDGISLHFYGDKNTPASTIPRVLKEFPDKFVLYTEACNGPQSPKDEKVVLGSWDRAKTYFTNILENLNYNVVGWLDWNLFLDTEGGPTWTKNFVDSSIIVDYDKQEFYKQPTYYAIGHFSKFVPRGSQRIKVKTILPVTSYGLDIIDFTTVEASFFDNVAFITPKGTIVVIIHNEGAEQNCAIQLGDSQATVLLEAESITTVEIPYDGKSLGTPCSQ